MKGAHRLEWACTRRHAHVHVHRAAACWRWGADIGQGNDFKGGVAGQIGARTAETEVWLALPAKPPFLGGTRALKLSPIQGRSIYSSSECSPTPTAQPNEPSSSPTTRSYIHPKFPTLQNPTCPITLTNDPHGDPTSPHQWSDPHCDVLIRLSDLVPLRKSH